MSKKPAPKKKPGSQADGVRGTLWYFEPHELDIVGFDTDEQEHELCDHASNKFHAEHYEEYIQYMRLNGIDKPVLFRRDGERKLVVEGRTTTRVARVVAPLWEKDRRAEGLKGDACKLLIPAVVRRGTADELFCMSRATNRRRPGSDDPVEEARAVARLVKNGATEEQAAVRLGLPPARTKQLLALLSLHPKVQRQVGAGVSLDAAVKLAKLPEGQQVAKLAEIQATGEKPTARAVTNKLREGSGRAPFETPAQKLKRIGGIVDSLRLTYAADKNEQRLLDAIDKIEAILRPPPREQCSRCGRPESATCCLEPLGRAVQSAEREAEFGA